MFDFRKLLKVLEKELKCQEQLLELLSQERVAIVKLNQEQIERIREAKENILTEAIDIEQRRKQIFSALAETAKRTEPLKLADVIELCPPQEGRGQLRHVGETLKKVATSVFELNDQNGELIKQSLGLIASTVAIMRAAPEADLPTYTQKGSLTSTNEDPAFGAKNQFSREA
jgi:flagellar biosynthesis/type III secretory pathway chaperone